MADPGKGQKDPTKGKFPPRGKKSDSAAAKLIAKALKGRDKPGSDPAPDDTDDGDHYRDP